MMLKALVELSQRERLVLSYEPKPVRFYIHIGDEGHFVSVESAPLETRHTDPKGKPRGKPAPPARFIPRRTRTAGDKSDPEFLVDKAEYVFGIDPYPERKSSRKSPERVQEQLNEKRRDFAERVSVASKSLPSSSSLAAVVDFLRKEIPQEILRLLDSSNPRELQELSGALFAFVYEPDGGTRFVHEEPEIQEWFRKQLKSTDGQQRGQCLVTGESDRTLTRLHAAPKGIPPISATKGGVPLTSINQEAFASYGLDRIGGAPVSQSANFAIDTALTRLIDPAYPGPTGSPLPRRSFTIGPDSILLYWTRQEAALDFFGFLEDCDPEEVAEMLRSPYGSAKPPLEDPTDFYALILSGKQGRAIVRSFIESTVRDVALNVDRYQTECRIERPYGNTAGGFGLHDIRRALSPRGEVGRLPPAFGTALYLAIILGRSFPGTVLETVVRRNRAELLPNGHNLWPLAARTALLKAWFKRNKGKEIPVALDKQRTEVAYRLGRLLATLDKLQNDVLPAVNASVVDRFFGSASSTPAAVFPTLVRRSRGHLTKLRHEKQGLAIDRERLLQEIYSTLDDFPKTLGLEDQGLFSIGFYHQRQALFTKKEEH